MPRWRSPLLSQAMRGEFIARMNREAKRLGMNDTQFLNPTGLSQQGHYSTAHDLARAVARAAARDFRSTPGSTRRRALPMARITQENRKPVAVSGSTVDGLKTGHTDAAGWCIIATVNRPPRKLLTVLLGAPQRGNADRESQKLIEWAFAAYEGRRLHEAVNRSSDWRCEIGRQRNPDRVSRRRRRRSPRPAQGWETPPSRPSRKDWARTAAGDTVGLLQR